MCLFPFCSDFAYVARDSTTRVHRCHVFRCDVAAKQIANTLKEICSRLAKERKKSPATNKDRPDKLDALQLVAEKGKGMGNVVVVSVMW